LQPPTRSAIEIEVAVPGVRPIAVGIDALGDVEEVVVRPLPPLLSQLGPYAGAVLRGNGSLRLMLDAAIVSAELWKRIGAQKPL
jgi:chemotaxis protein histidine kinase CheA